MFLICMVNPMLVNIYRERSGELGFFAEPFNACSNLAFVLATIYGMRYLKANNVCDRVSWGLVLLPTLIAIGSFAFHTVPNSLTMWADMPQSPCFSVSWFGNSLGDCCEPTELHLRRSWLSCLYCVQLCFPIIQS